MEIKNSMKMCFAYGSDCMVLTVKPTPQYCESCKVFKTKRQFDAAMQEAEESLKRRGLKRKSITVHGEKKIIAAPDYD